MNRATMIGRLGKDPTIRETQSGKSVCTFSIAVGRRFDKDATNWFDVVVWGEQGKRCHQYLTKGRQASVTGSVQMRSYEAQDGTKRTVVELIADEVEFIGGAQEKPDRGDAYEPPQARAQQEKFSYTAPDDEDDSLPF